MASSQNVAIAVIGAGKVGQALGEHWQSLGHKVRYGVPDPAASQYNSLAGRVSLPADAAKHADVIVLATPWDATEDACRSLGDVGGKIIVDCTNPIAQGPDGPRHALGLASSAAEHVHDWCHNARVFKTLNQAGFETMADPGRHPVKLVMFVAGDDANAKQTVMGLVEALGFEAADAGPLANARLLEAYALLWVDQVFKRGQPRTLAFAFSRI